MAVNNHIDLKGSKDVSHGIRRLAKLFEKGDDVQAFPVKWNLGYKTLRKSNGGNIYFEHQRSLVYQVLVNSMEEVIPCSSCSVYCAFSFQEVLHRRLLSLGSAVLPRLSAPLSEPFFGGNHWGPLLPMLSGDQGKITC